MTIDQLIDSIKSDAVDRAVDLGVAALRGATSWFITPWGAWFLTWILSPIVKVVARAVVNGLDLGAYYSYKAMKNPADAEKYQDAVRENKRANESGDKDAIKKAKEKRKRQFAVVVDLRA